MDDQQGKETKAYCGEKVEEKPFTLTEDQELGKATITLSPKGDDNPHMVVCFGWKSPEEFNQAFQKEGWSEPGGYTNEDLRQMYGKVNEVGAFDFTEDQELGTRMDFGFRKMTVTSWD